MAKGYSGPAEADWFAGENGAALRAPSIDEQRLQRTVARAVYAGRTCGVPAEQIRKMDDATIDGMCAWILMVIGIDTPQIAKRDAVALGFLASTAKTGQVTEGVWAPATVAR